MTVDFNGIINAIDRLISAIENGSGFVQECFSGAIGIFCSVISVLIFEAIKVSYFEPRKEFRTLRTNVYSVLSMYACYFTNVIVYGEADEKSKREYSEASKATREIAVKLSAFAVSYKGKKCCRVKVVDMVEASASLFGLSNSFFCSDRKSELEIIQHNHKRRIEIQTLLKIDEKTASN